MVRRFFDKRQVGVLLMSRLKPWTGLMNKENAPVSWAMLSYELDDAEEHLQKLILDMQRADFSETDFRVQLTHIYAHLNRAWNRRNVTDAECIADAENSDSISRNADAFFPKDIQPEE
jgi:hypothetical protein